MKSPNRQSISQLQDLPNIGKAMTRDLNIVGIHAPKDLIGKDGYQLFHKLCKITGMKHDPCVIDVFLSVVAFMEGGDPKPWWKFTAKRKEHMESQQ